MHQRPLSVGGRLGLGLVRAELTFGIEMGDRFQEPVLLIKTCWGRHSLYGNFQPPAPANRPITQATNRRVGRVLSQNGDGGARVPPYLGTDFPVKGAQTELSNTSGSRAGTICVSRRRHPPTGYMANIAPISCIWFRIRAEFKTPNLPVVVGELGVGGEKATRP